MYMNGKRPLTDAKHKHESEGCTSVIEHQQALTVHPTRAHFAKFGTPVGQRDLEPLLRNKMDLRSSESSCSISKATLSWCSSMSSLVDRRSRGCLSPGQACRVNTRDCRHQASTANKQVVHPTCIRDLIMDKQP